MKKGNIGDINSAIFIIFVTFLGIVIMYPIVDNFTERIQYSNATNFSQVNDAATSFKSKYLSAWDGAFLVLLILLPIFSYIAASKVPVDIQVSIFAFIILAFVIILSMVVSNIYGMFIENSIISSVTSQMTLMPKIMPKLPYYALIYSFIVLVGLYGKKKSV